jgi:NAD(P)-dependent dehydrogenase (short-subunit alcohol dehydrogenase family)
VNTPIHNLFSLDGEVALVTGGGTGLGRAIALMLAEAGARVVVVGRRLEPLQDVAAGSPRIEARRYDVTVPEEAPALIEEVTDTVGTPSILVNNAGVHLKKDAVTTSVEEFQAVLQTHVLGAHALNSAVIPGMSRQKHGSIVFIASMAAIFGLPMVVAYSAAKSAYLGMVRALAVELGSDGIRVNAIAPGWIDSEMMRRTMDNDTERSARVLSRTPLGRFGEARDIGAAALYLCSPAARFITGTCLTVDGGASIGF